MSIPIQEQKILSLTSGGICAFPDCGASLVNTEAGTPSIVGQMAHIVAQQRQGPRGRAEMSDTDRNMASNLVLLCGKHHIFRELSPMGWSYDDQGVAVFFKHRKDYDKATHGIAKGPTGLHRLIDQKKQLAGSLGLVPTQAVGQDELFGEIFGNAEANGNHRSRPIGIADAVKLSWDHFEALIACLYEPDSERVILTPRGRDHGADVLVLGHNADGNILVQVKTTAASKLDSEAAIRELKGAEPFFVNAMGQQFPVKRLHTNAKHFSRRTLKAAKLYKTEAQGQSWLEERLKRISVTMAEIISRNAHRESI